MSNDQQTQEETQNQSRDQQTQDQQDQQGRQDQDTPAREQEAAQALNDVDGLADKKPEELTPEELRLMADTMPGEGPGD